MVGMTNSSLRETYASLVFSTKAAMDIPLKLEYLRRLKQDLIEEENVIVISEILPRIFDLQSDSFAPVRKFVTEIIGEVGLKHVQFLPEIMPVLISVLDDSAPAVARQAITCGLDLFRSTLVKLAIQGLHSSELDNSVESSWTWILKFKEKIYLMAFQGSGGVRLLALKFVEAVILLYTPDPNGSLKPSPDEGNLVEFNISWLRGGHPVLNIGDLSIEAGEKLGLLLDQLRFPTVKSLSSLVIVVLINSNSPSFLIMFLFSLSAIAKKRPAYYGRILPVLLALDPPSSVIKGMHLSSAHHALKNALLSCLKCTHPGAAPLDALKEMKAGELAERALSQVCKANGSVEDIKNDLPVIKEEKPSIQACDDVRTNLGRKRSGADDNSDPDEENEVSGKRVRSTLSVSEESSKALNRNIIVSQDQIPSTGSASNKGHGDTGPVQQLVAMFGVLVAQGENAIRSLQILISSISADLLAEVVMANMCNLPLNCSQADGDEESVLEMTIIGSDTGAKYPASFLADVLSLSSSFLPIASLLDEQHSMANDAAKPQREEELLAPAVADGAVLFDGFTPEAEVAALPTGVVASSDVLPKKENSDLSISSDNHDVGSLESDIPGLNSSACNDGFSETFVTSSLATKDIEDVSQEQETGERSLLDLPSVSTDRSEETSPKTATMDPNSLIASTATSVTLSSPFALPKMSAPVVDLADEQKDQLQNSAFMRILKAYKQVAVAGGSQIRFSLLAYIGVEFPSELDPWKPLQEHILEDYVNHEGQELTLRVLYRLYGEAEEERDFFSSTTASAVYETFLLTVAETLRDSFPPSDKSLSRLLCEVPYLPKSVVKFLECLCSPGNGDKSDKDLQSGDRVTQGLSAVWSLILLRPPLQDVCLRIALQSAVHHLEEVRMKAIRLVANKLYPLSSIAQQIEDFARETLLSVINVDSSERADANGSTIEALKDSDLEKPSNDLLSVGALGKDISTDTHQSCTTQSASFLSIPQAQRCMSLYFALCTKKHSLFHQIFVIYKDASTAVKQAVQRHIPILVRTMGSSSGLLEIISDPPSGSESLLMQVLHTLTDGTVPSPELIFTIRKLYDSKLKDVEILIPVLPFLPREEALLIFPRLVNLPLDKFQAALARTLQGSSNSGAQLSPAEVLIAIHGIDPDRDGIPLKKAFIFLNACNACFEQRQIFTQQVLAKVLNQLVEQIPLPLLFMRTVLQAIGAFPALVEFVMEILSRLISKQIWKYPKLWVGFLKCAHLTQPQSFNVLLQLPPPQLENALNRIAALKAPLIAHASQLNIRSSLPRSVLAVLGIASDSQTSSQAQTSQGQTGDINNSEKETMTDKSKEESSSAS
ncbi:hypothetical protein Patl1_31343 [Pistacia atlantica]|uniref:Uncharacterized protein n=1 Tax=Pistacia atlantica TaxID=434234 RepID=A0ACC1ARG7_9ROSI|nr:hypothetical protein Patl1_31343 [Pistacia atlantica]